MTTCITIRYPARFAGFVGGVPAYVTQHLTGAQRKPVPNAESFQEILAAAFVLQEHNDRAAKEPQSDYTQTLTQILETQKLIQARHLSLREATTLIAQRSQKLTNASGAAVGIVEGDQLAYYATAGCAAADVGSRVALNTCLSADCLRTGKVLRCPQVKKDLRSQELWRQRGIGSLIAVPVFNEEQLAGVLELRFADPYSFQDSDVRTSELMAGLVAEAVAEAAELEQKQTLTAERTAVLEALQRIKPQLERMIGERPAIPARSEAIVEKAAGEVSICRGCGHRLDDGELYCGNCGIARSVDAPKADIQSKWASLWYMQQAAERNQKSNPVDESQPEVHPMPEPVTTVLPVSLEDIVAQFSSPDDLMTEDETDSTTTAESLSQTTIESSTSLSASERTLDNEIDLTSELEADSTLDANAALRIVPAELGSPPDGVQLSPWRSARKAHQWLESLKEQHRPNAIWLARQWQVRRANIYLGLSVILLLVVLAGWGTQSDQSGNSATMGGASSLSARRRNPPPPDLTLFERLLVNLGLAEPPPATVYLGNPDTRVWVDLHTALYYCPGAGLYGKTPGGKLTTQRDAQQDQFEPANRRACD